MEDAMYDPPAYLWAITIAGTAAIAVAACIVLYGGAERAGLGRRRAALLAGAAAVLLGGWFTATAVIAGHGWYHGPLSHGPWLHRAWPVAWSTRTRSGWLGWSGCSPWPSATCPRCSPCPRAWVTSPPASPRRWSRAGSRGAPAAAPPCGTTRSA